MMNVEKILAKLVSFPILGGESNTTILNWIKEYLESYKVEVNLVPNKNKYGSLKSFNDFKDYFEETMYPELSDSKLERVINVINKF